MTERQAEKMLDEFTPTLASSIGFNRIDKDLFGRPEHDATALLAFPWWLSTRGAGFTAWVGLRFESLANWLDDDSAVKRPMLSKRLNVLREDKSLGEWGFSNVDDLEKLRDPILNDLKQHGLPFIERYSRLTEVRKTLESPDKKDWIGVGLSVDSRVTTLAAIQHAEGEKAGAIKTLDDGMKALEESLANKPPELRKRELRKRGFDMEYLRKRLA
jgi:hypothetical protein